MSDTTNITKDTFVWKMKDKTYKIDEMTPSFKLVALTHALKLSTRSHKNFEKYKEKSRRNEKVLQEKLESITNKIKEFEKERDEIEKAIKQYNEKSSDFFDKTDYFQQLADVLKESLLEDHSLLVPEDIDDIWSFKRMYDKGIIKENAP